MSRIAVNTRFLRAGELEGYGYFLQEILKRLVSENPGHEFLFIFDRPYDPRFIYAENVIPLVMGPPARHPLLWKWWFQVRIPALLRKQKADVFLSTDGFCSLRTRVPQCLVIHDLAFLHVPDTLKKGHLSFYKTQTPRFAKKADALWTVSEFSKKDICRQYGLPTEKVGVLYNAARELFQPLDPDARQAVRDQYSGGHHYFVYTGAIHPRKNLMQLLRAFSLFKKRQRSNLKLLLVGRLAWSYQEFLDALKSYKFRDEVVLTGYLAEEEQARVLAASYALVYPSLWEGCGMPVIEAMQCGVPVITTANSAMEEMGKGAVLTVDVSDHTAIAEQMMRLYKDEDFRSRLIEKGKPVAAGYSWDRSARQLMESLEKLLKGFN